MKVILTKDLKKIGKKDEVVNVSDGYARNYLFPRKLAKEASDANVHILDKKNESERKRKLEEIESAQELAEKLKGKPVKMIANSGDNGRLFGAITTKDIADAIKEQYDMVIDKKKIVTDTIKQLGAYEVEVKIYPEVSTNINVIISES